MDLSASSKTPWEPAALLVIMAVSLGLRLAYVVQIDTAPFSDMADYETMALNLLEGRGLVMDTPHLLYKAYRPPAYPLFIAGIYGLLGVNPENVRIVQSVLSALTLPLIYLLGCHLFGPHPRETRTQAEGIELESLPKPCDRTRGRRIGLLGAGLFGLEETSIFFCGQLLSETLFVFLILLWSYPAVRLTRSPGVLRAMMIGAIGGLAMLTRPLFGPVILFGALWFYQASLRAFNPPPRDWSRFSFFDSPYAPPLAILVYAGLIVSLWTVRNFAVLEAFVPVSTNGGVNFYLGHHEDFGYASFGNKEGIRRELRERNIHDEVLESQFFQLKGWEFILNHPQQEAINTIRKIYYLYLAPVTWKSAFQPWKWWNYLESPYRPWPWESADRKVRFWERADESGKVRLPTYRDWFWREGRLPLINWNWLMIYLTVGGAMLALARRENVGFLFGMIAVYTLCLLFFFTNARFRTPILPFLYLFAAYAIATLCGLNPRRRKRKGSPVWDSPKDSSPMNSVRNEEGNSQPVDTQEPGNPV